MAKSPAKKTAKKSSKSKANATQDLFGSDYTAKDIEVLEGLEPCLLYTSPSPRD